MSSKASILLIFAVNFLVAYVTAGCPPITTLYFINRHPGGGPRSPLNCSVVPGAYKAPAQKDMCEWRTCDDLKNHFDSVYCGKTMCWFGHFCDCVDPSPLFEVFRTKEEIFMNLYYPQVSVVKPVRS